MRCPRLYDNVAHDLHSRTCTTSYSRVHKSSDSFTVVKWGHTEGIEREKTSSQKYTVIALDFWRDEFFLVFQIWGQNIIGGQFLEHYHLIWNCPWFLKRFLIFQIWGYYLQKVNAKCPQISDEKDKFFFPLINIFFLFFKGSKVISQRDTTLFLY